MSACGACLALAAWLVVAPADRAAADPPLRPLTVLTLNVAHGRGAAPGLLVDAAAARANLGRIADVLRRERPDVVALQEADAECFWSGGFDHVAHLAESSGLPHRVHGRHVDTEGLRYGTALLARESLTRSQSVRFDPAPPLPPKGFVVATAALPGGERIHVDIVSVHLDPVRPDVRTAQLERMIKVLAGRGRPLVVAGDFNCDWDDEPTLRRLCAALGLSAYRPDDETLATFPSTGRRLDWILCSRELRVRDYRALNDPLSDHRAVAAVLEYVPGGRRKPRSHGGHGERQELSRLLFSSVPSVTPSRHRSGRS